MATEPPPSPSIVLPALFSRDWSPELPEYWPFEYPGTRTTVITDSPHFIR